MMDEDQIPQFLGGKCKCQGGQCLQVPFCRVAATTEYDDENDVEIKDMKSVEVEKETLLDKENQAHGHRPFVHVSFSTPIDRQLNVRNV